MNCANHPETPATAFCRECGKPMCVECQRPVPGSVYCQEHLPEYAAPSPPPPPAQPYEAPPASTYSGSAYSAPGSPYSPPTSPYSATTSPYTNPGTAPDPSVHPVLALILGFAPGVGAIYNGQYAKGLVHAVIFGLLVTMVSNTHNDGMAAMIGIMIAVWVVYQAFEAFHTARQRRYGVRVEEFSSLFEVRQGHGRFPGSAILLIGLGFILLLNTTDIVRMEQLEPYWPLLLIGVGVYMLYVRLNPPERAHGRADGEVRR